MKAIFKFIKSEPAIILTAVGALVSLALSFGLHLTPDQVKAVYSFAAALTGVIIRQLVTPVNQ
jgi:hypothetical protein